jgi:hypothetical protein
MKIDKGKVDKGQGMVEFAVYFILAMFITSGLIFGILPVWFQYQDLSYTSKEVLHEAELVGNTGSLVTEEYKYIQSVTGLIPKEISFEGTEYISGTKNVQINDRIQVTVTSDFVWFSSFIGEGFTTELVSVSSGKSGVYYK